MFSPFSPLFSWTSFRGHLLLKTDNIPDGVLLLATHKQINQSNNTPINSNYTLLSPGRSLQDPVFVWWLEAF